MRYVFAMGLLFAGSIASPAQADPYQWCAIYGGDFGGGGTNCYFTTLSQCQATLSGNGGICRRNTEYTGAETQGRKGKQRLDRREYNR